MRRTHAKAHKNNKRWKLRESRRLEKEKILESPLQDVTIMTATTRRPRADHASTRILKRDSDGATPSQKGRGVPIFPEPSKSENSTSARKRLGAATLRDFSLDEKVLTVSVLVASPHSVLS